MPQNEQRRPGAGSGAAVTSLAGDVPQYSDFLTESKAFDPIEQVLARRAAAADRGSPLSVGRRARVLVRRVPSGFSVERGVGR
jgi:hypothetical protein